MAAVCPDILIVIIVGLHSGWLTFNRVRFYFYDTRRLLFRAGFFRLPTSKDQIQDRETAQVVRKASGSSIDILDKAVVKSIKNLWDD